MTRNTFLLLLLLVAACDELDNTICTEIGCDNSFELTINAEDDSLSLGDYAVHILRESDEEMSCTFTLRQTGAGCSSIDCVENRSCDQFAIDNVSFAGAVYYSHPDEKIIVKYPPLEGELDITISQNGEPLLNIVAEPVYETSQPNGPGCDPICFNARNDVIISRE